MSGHLKFNGPPCSESERVRLPVSSQSRCHWHRHGGGPSPVLTRTLQVKHIEYSGKNDPILVVSGYVTGFMD
jgi:hypothetical protein